MSKDLLSLQPLLRVCSTEAGKQTSKQPVPHICRARTGATGICDCQLCLQGDDEHGNDQSKHCLSLGVTSIPILITIYVGTYFNKILEGLAPTKQSKYVRNNEAALQKYAAKCTSPNPPWYRRSFRSHY